MNTPLCLTIAGSDNSGGAGIQADLRTFHAMGCYGLSTITAITAQTPMSVHSVHPVPAHTIETQLGACLELQPSVVKTGMLYSPEIIQVVANTLDDFKGPIVTDPVMTAGCGETLNESGMVDELARFIQDRVTVLTPNLHEAHILMPNHARDDLESLALALAEQFSVDVLLKGGHAANENHRSWDVLVAHGECHQIKTPLLKPHASHGTGCTLAAALAAGLANGKDMVNAAVAAKAFVWHSLKNSKKITPAFAAMISPTQLDVSMVECTKL